MNRFWVFITALVTLALSWIAYFYGVQWLGSTDPMFIATVLAVSIFVHELAHYVVMEGYGISCFMFFVVILGGVAPKPSSRTKYKNLSWDKMAKISLAGVIGNLFVIVASSLIYITGQLSAHDLSRIADINAGLIVFNLLPFGILDGGRFAKVFFDSSPEHLDSKYFKKMAVAVITIAILVFIVTAEPFLVFAAIFTTGLHSKSKEDDPQGAFNKKAMTVPQLCLWGFIYIALIGIGMTIDGFTDSWVK